MRGRCWTFCEKHTWVSRAREREVDECSRTICIYHCGRWFDKAGLKNKKELRDVLRVRLARNQAQSLLTVCLRCLNGCFSGRLSSYPGELRTRSSRLPGTRRQIPAAASAGVTVGKFAVRSEIGTPFRVAGSTEIRGRRRDHLNLYRNAVYVAQCHARLQEVFSLENRPRPSSL